MKNSSVKHERFGEFEGYYDPLSLDGRYMYYKMHHSPSKGGFTWIPFRIDI